MPRILTYPVIVSDYNKMVHPCICRGPIEWHTRSPDPTPLDFLDFRLETKLLRKLFVMSGSSSVIFSVWSWWSLHESPFTLLICRSNRKISIGSLGRKIVMDASGPLFGLESLIIQNDLRMMLSSPTGIKPPGPLYLYRLS